ncbi:unnamed protein product [Zymoseptoria tritici ST99CH_1A5]|uniref:PX-associated domain-containing protein n=2 Tax=Zymoseptoria tritici TaxID=1047171 RepID=A0A1Y6LJF0_ZYMTR|nr:unnamed protein product [Zymoseptoria tritici ST99CH_3D1]SMY24435.1 unnamed protein product [Zymoseptoria tritici ST99CH_1A5]
MAESDSSGLTAEQSDALLDVLTHHETYQEIEDFKTPGAIFNYGPPFQDDLNSSQAPILQALLSKFVLKLPGLRDVPAEFWKGRIEKLIQELAEAELSESYDKGVLGIRKTLATAISALIEYPARGILSFPKQPIDRSRKYDVANADDVLQAWKDCVQDLVYGDLIDRLVQRVAETDDLTKHETLVQAFHEFILVNLASIMHYTLVLSPEGASIVRMIENVHNLLPYTIMRQTLKIGNVATMLSGLVRVVLAKASMASVTNWMGLSSGADEGMNLLQQIISQVLGWDKRELKKRADKLEKDKDGPPKEVQDELKDWIKRSRAEHEECRTRSRESNMSIVAVILSLSSVSADLSPLQHDKAHEYLSVILAIRDRQEIVRVMCKRNPDILTAAIREAVDAYTPMIRHVHQAVNLSDTLWDFERFLTDMLSVAKPKGSKGQEKAPSVEDFVDLLHRHQSSVHKFLHQAAKNGKEMVSWWQDYAHKAVAQFRCDETPPSSASVVSDKMTMGGAKTAMHEEFAKLSQDDQKVVKQELEAHRKYVDDIHTASATRIKAVIERTRSSPFGPGAFLARWQQLLDNTVVTPATFQGPVRYGSTQSVKAENRKDVDGIEHGGNAVNDKPIAAPKVDNTLRLLAAQFRTALVQG